MITLDEAIRRCDSLRDELQRLEFDMHQMGEREGSRLVYETRLRMSHAREYIENRRRSR